MSGVNLRDKEDVFSAKGLMFRFVGTKPILQTELWETLDALEFLEMVCIGERQAGDWIVP
uniref:Uncharacterized protein n=1 Tax=Arion vulgaris TaxID=1028688 RepID=A0A0B6ZN31_9EUPU